MDHEYIASIIDPAVAAKEVHRRKNRCAQRKSRMCDSARRGRLARRLTNTTGQKRAQSSIRRDPLPISPVCSSCGLLEPGGTGFSLDDDLHSLSALEFGLLSKPPTVDFCELSPGRLPTPPIRALLEKEDVTSASDAGLISFAQEALCFERSVTSCFAPPEIVMPSSNNGMALADTIELCGMGDQDLSALAKTQRPRGKTALHIAAEHGRVNVSRMLIGSGVDIDRPDEDGRTAIHVAAAYGSVEIVHLLIRSRADINATDARGWTALHITAGAGLEDMVALLIQAGADVQRAVVCL